MANNHLTGNRKKLILVMNKHKAELLEHSESGARLLLNQDVEVLTLPIEENPNMIEPDFLERIRLKNQDKENNILIQNPYQLNTYEVADEAHEQFALQKHLMVSHLCQLLGAREVLIEQVKIQNESKVEKVKGNLNASGVEAEVSYEKEAEDRFKGKLSLKDAFNGSEPNIEEATEYLNKHNLQFDETLKNLIDMRSCKTNQHFSRELIVNLSSEAKINLKVAASLKASLNSIDVTYNADTDSKKEYMLNMVITF